MSVLIGKAMRGQGRDRPAAEILLTNNRVAEDATIGTIVGRLFVENGYPPYAFLLLGAAAGRFVLIGDEIRVASPLDYELATEHDITVLAVRIGGAGASITQTLTIIVTDVVETPPYVPTYLLMGF